MSPAARTPSANASPARRRPMVNARAPRPERAIAQLGRKPGSCSSSRPPTQIQTPSQQRRRRLRRLRRGHDGDGGHRGGRPRRHRLLGDRLRRPCPRESAPPRAATRARPGEATTKALATIGDAPHAIVLLFVDSEAGDQAGDRRRRVRRRRRHGSLAGGAARRGRRPVRRGRALSDGVVAVAIGSTTPIGVGIAHGCVPRGAPSIVTRSEGPKVIQLDGRPAQDVPERLGVDGADLGESEFNALDGAPARRAGAERRSPPALCPSAHRRRGLSARRPSSATPPSRSATRRPRPSSVVRAQL